MFFCVCVCVGRFGEWIIYEGDKSVMYGFGEIRQTESVPFIISDFDIF